MKQMIACCGIDCEHCDAYIATINDDNEKREETAQKWREAFGAPDISAESINCTGCRMDGVKFSHCNVCNIRQCATDKGFSTCGACAELDTCQIVAFVFEHAPETKANLLS
ncbi:MAG: DUF3795 domain-containing protein [Tannerella sp.]|jgi:hypothetical protein|nr:DUF3795 domain-containing protein [Tannerella sp.]